MTMKQKSFVFLLLSCYECVFDLVANGKWWFWLQQWHPDKWTRTPSLLGEAKRKFQQIQEAYSGKVAIFSIGINMCLFVFHKKN